MTRQRQCSLSGYMDGPWRCSSGGCDGGDGCKAPIRNAAEAEWLAARAWDNAWLAHYGLPVLTIRDARSAIR